MLASLYWTDLISLLYFPTLYGDYGCNPKLCTTPFTILIIRPQKRIPNVPKYMGCTTLCRKDDLRNIFKVGRCLSPSARRHSPSAGLRDAKMHQPIQEAPILVCACCTLPFRSKPNLWDMRPLSNLYHKPRFSIFNPTGKVPASHGPNQLVVRGRGASLVVKGLRSGKLSRIRTKVKLAEKAKIDSHLKASPT